MISTNSADNHSLEKRKKKNSCFFTMGIAERSTPIQNNFKYFGRENYSTPNKIMCKPAYYHGHREQNIKTNVNQN